VWNQLGLCRTSVGNLAEAIDAFKKATSMDEQFAEAYLNMGLASKEVCSSCTSFCSSVVDGVNV
jgi:lipoprotein NlpI